MPQFVPRHICVSGPSDNIHIGLGMWLHPREQRGPRHYDNYDKCNDHKGRCKVCLWGEGINSSCTGLIMMPRKMCDFRRVWVSTVDECGLVRGSIKCALQAAPGKDKAASIKIEPWVTHCSLGSGMCDMSPAYPEGRSKAGQGSVCRAYGCGLWFRQALVPLAPGMGSKVQPGQCHEPAGPQRTGKIRNKDQRESHWSICEYCTL